MSDEIPLAGHRPQVINPLAQYVVNAFMSRSSFNQSLYDGAYGTRDVDRECGYPQGLTIGDFQAMYRRQDIAARVNDIEPNECWKEYPEILETEEERETEFEKAIDALVADTNLYSYLARADRISGIGRYGVVFVGFDDGEDFDVPAPGFGEMSPKATPGMANVLYYRVFDESGVSIAEYDTDKKSKRRGLPKYYTLTFEDGDTSTASLKVHWSRVIHIADNLTSSLVFGAPRMENVFNRLYDLRKISGGAAEMFWKGGFPGLSFEVDPKHGEFSEDDKAALKEETKAYSEGLMRYITTVGVRVKSIAPQIANPDAHINSCLKIIAITKGVPMQQFMGTTAGTQDGAADTKTWGERIALRRNMYITPHIIRPLIDRLIQAGAVPKPLDGYTVKWKPLATLTEVERAQVGKDLTEALARYSTAGAEALVPLPEFLGKFLGFSFQQVEAIMKAPATKLSVVLQELAMGMTGSGNGNMPTSIPTMAKKKDPGKTPVNMVQKTTKTNPPVTNAEVENLPDIVDNAASNTDKIMEAIKVLASKETNVVVKSEPAQVHITQAPTRVQIKQKPANINIPVSPTPVVNNTVNVPEQKVNVRVPKQKPPAVHNTINVPEQKTPVVNNMVNVPTPEVTVNINPEIKTLLMPSPPAKGATVIRDEQGRITEIKPKED